MSLEDKVDQAKGAVKETVGKVTDDKKTEFEGAAEKTTAKVKDVAEDVKDAAEEKIEKAKDAVKEGVDKITDESNIEKAATKVKDVAEDIKDAVEEKIHQAKDAVTEGVDKITSDKNLTIISIVSAIVSALIVGSVVSLFFVKKTKKLLGSYRRIKAILSDGEKFSAEEQIEIRWKFIEDLMGNSKEIAGKSERTIKDAERKREEDLYCAFRIEKAVEMYREECEKIGSEEAKRRYRELNMMYLSDTHYTVQEISEIENISDKTIYKDLGIACSIVAIYLWGVDL